MSPIIQPTKEFVNTKLNSKALSQKDAQLQEKLMTKLFEIYEKLNIVFMGTPEFAVPILKALTESEFKPKAVITAPDKPAGRGNEVTPSPIKISAQQNEIPVFQPDGKEALLKQTTELKPDLIIVTAYGKILPKEIIELPKYGVINVHPSLLPKYRGPSPIQFAILEGDEETGVTIMLVDEKMDEGPILSQQMVKIEKDETSATLEKKLSDISARLLIRTLNHWVVLKEMPQAAQNLIQPQKQDNLKATYTKILTKQDGKIIWTKTAKEIERQIRAFQPWPGSFTVFKNPKLPENENLLTLKFLKASVLEINAEKELGQVFLTSTKKLAVQAGQGVLAIEQLQLEGGKPLNAEDFLNGHPGIIDSVLQ